MELVLFGFALVPIITGLTEVVKRAVKLEKRFVPLVAVLLGVILMVGLNGFTPESITEAIVAGLAASGLWDLGKKTVAGR